jgi:hypothetical protein
MAGDELRFMLKLKPRKQLMLWLRLKKRGGNKPLPAQHLWKASPKFILYVNTNNFIE